MGPRVRGDDVRENAVIARSESDEAIHSFDAA
jgi:hypothetical protein